MPLEAGERPVLRRKGLTRFADDRPRPPLASDSERFGCPPAGWRRRLHTVIFEADTRAGLAFDIAVIVAILASIAVVMVDSVQPLAQRHGRLLAAAEWGFTALFTLEYLARLASVQRPLRYVTSFYGVIDLLALLPTYLAAVVPEAHLLIDVRVLRLLRVFRIFRLTAFLSETAMLAEALRASARKIAVFLSFVLMVVLVMGTVMHVLEGPANGFTSIPMAMYWAVTTMTTVGYGDITPKTEVGRLIASVMMLLGWGVLAVPTGIVTAEMTLARRHNSRARRCPACDTAAATDTARHCHQCGARLPAFGRRTA
ncbi:ion transporter [Aquabacterium sp. J223]|uniref:ion transporter n=1 Tax=Aquabacterium sp. J223 TaxID=2898431 RepID=UPI0021AD7148|nr:ion transporter [Aquabacterium sp. J223]UUX95976.1 ion transporter [Aquabacterium sp. J223]